MLNFEEISELVGLKLEIVSVARDERGNLSMANYYLEAVTNTLVVVGNEISMLLMVVPYFVRRQRRFRALVVPHLPHCAGKNATLFEAHLTTFPTFTA